MKKTYKSSGVNIDVSTKFTQIIKFLSKKTIKKKAGMVKLENIGSFAGFFEISKLKYKNPILVTGADGVGTKIKIAQMLNDYRTIGIDLVAMSINDLIVHGAKPIFFLDYIAVGKLRLNQSVKILKGIINGCVQSQCILIGGETAEMPDIYKKNNCDLAGFAVGVVEKKKLLPTKNIKNGDVIIGIKSNGLHSNGFSLVRKIIKEKKIHLNKPFPYNKKITFGKELIKPTKIYMKPLSKLFEKDLVKACAHITGGGLIDNIPRTLVGNFRAEIDLTKWHLPKIYKWLNDNGVSKKEMLKTFNCGIGMTVIVSRKNEKKVLKILKNNKAPSFNIGRVVKSKSNFTLTLGKWKNCD